MNRFIYFFSGIILLGVLGALLWAARTHQETVQSLHEILARDFRPLLEGERVTDINLGAIEERAEELKREYPYINEVIVRKMNPDGSSTIVYPLFNNIDRKDSPPDEDPTFRSLVLTGDDGNTLGTLYVKISPQRGRFFMLAIAGSIWALVVVSALGFYAIRSKDQEVRKTTSLLEEKQRELIHLERLSLVGQVTANLLHDLKKPVLNIRAESDALPESDVKRTIQDETDLFLSLVRDLHLEGFLRRDRERGEFIDVAELLERSLRLVKYAQGNVRVTLQLPENLPFVFAQRHQLVQVFSNILLNAFQALEGEGNIRAGAHYAEDAGEKWLGISFSDDGPGMPYEVQTRIFEPFFSTRKEAESTGLGLYISQSIVEGLGGTLTADSIPKHGTTFTIRLPLSDEETV